MILRKIGKSEPDAESNAHDGVPGQASGGMTEAVLILGPPAAPYVLSADSASVPSAVDLTSLFDIKFLHFCSPF